MKKKILTTILPIVGATAVVTPIVTLTSCSKAIEVNVDQLQTGIGYNSNHLKSEAINVSKDKVYIASVDASKMADQSLGLIKFGTTDWIAGEEGRFKFTKIECSIAKGKWQEIALTQGHCETMSTPICKGHAQENIRFRFSFQDDYEGVVLNFFKNDC